jgi:hypothetical protein
VDLVAVAVAHLAQAVVTLFSQQLHLQVAVVVVQLAA